MILKSQDFFIGVIDFFSVILPGALATYFLKGLLYAELFGSGKVFPLPETTTQQWVVFLIATYIIGNIIFLVASLLLDRYVYDRYLRNRYFKKNFDLGYHTATVIRDQYLPVEAWVSRIVNSNKLNEKEIQELLGEEKQEIINTFKWSQNYLSIKFPEALIEIKKYIAGSKFFRSLVVAFLIIAVTLFIEREWVSGVGFFVLSLLSLFRYGDLRYKSTQKAYELIITVNHLEKDSISVPGSLEWDNRVLYEASSSDIEPFQNTISNLVKGFSVTNKVLSIPIDKTWKVKNASSSETVVCLLGNSVVKLSQENNPAVNVVLSSNAILPLPSKSSFEIKNRHQEPLVLLLTKWPAN